MSNLSALSDANISLRPRFATHWMVGAGVFGAMLQQLAIILGGLAGIDSGIGVLALLAAPLVIAGMIVGSAAQDSRTLEAFLGAALFTALIGLLNSLPPYELSLMGIGIASALSGTITAVGALIGRFVLRR